MVSINQQIACAPISTGIEHEKHTGFVVVKQKNQLVPTRVIFGTEREFFPGATVYLRGECINAPWARTIYTLENKSFILVPIADVLLVDNSTCFAPEPTSAPSGGR